MESLRALIQDMDAGAVEMLVVLGANPIYDAPADLPFAETFSKVKSPACGWGSTTTEISSEPPTAHSRSALSGDVGRHARLRWHGDHSAAPHRSALSREIGARDTGAVQRSARAATYDIVKGYWQKQKPSPDFEAWWRKSVHDGVVAGTAAAVKAVSPKNVELLAAAKVEGLEIVFRPDPTVYDGSFANNGWLQELPKPLSKLTWDNAALVSPATAEKLKLENMAEVELQYGGRNVKAGVWIVPGHAADSVTIHLGYGRRRAGHAASGAGFNAYRLRTAAAPWIGAGLAIRKTGGVYPLSSTQEHWRMEGRHPVRAGTVAEYKADPDFAQKMEELPAKAFSLYPEVKYEGHAWGMAIDLSACTGCNACVVACQSENNIPVVGKDQVAAGRARAGQDPHRPLLRGRSRQSGRALSARAAP